ncbi:MAG TPA: protein phosphatase 2C domain-containing protein, partial [Acidimicrobiales bacterium]|nr:protein phosphatase 2C domain-containing protein [Acidimicrobiales bacterium]
MTVLRSGSATDIGRNPRRTINQDMILEANGIFAVADGMGGHLGGEVASLTAIEALRANFDRDAGAEGLERAIVAANDAVVTESNTTADLRDMGTTLAVVALVDTDDEGLLAVANIGDSRIYLMRNGELSQLTDDHSLPEELYRRGQLTKAEAAVDPRRNIVTRVLGPSFGEGPDIQNLVPYVGDRLLICSDGLYNEVDDSAIARVLRTTGDPSDAARTLVDQANANGGGDNISVVVVDVVDDEGRAETASEVLADDPAPPPRAAVRREAPSASGLMTADQRNAELRRLAREERSDGNPWGSDEGEVQVHDEPSRRVTPRVVAFLVVLLLVVAGAGVAVGLYARGAYFVGLDEGTVAIFKGRPGGLLWFAPTVEERTALAAASVPQARAD